MVKYYMALLMRFWLSRLAFLLFNCFSTTPIRGENHTGKKLVLMKTYVESFHQKFYITDIENLTVIFYMYAYWVPITVANNAVRSFRTGGLIDV